jgi:pimeloyl-ACP methyl ester carboxylesterase
VSPVRQGTTLAAGVRREPVALTAGDGAELEGLLYSPETVGGTALVLMHPTVSFRHHYALIPLAARGVTSFGLDSRFAGNEGPLIMEKVVLDLAAGITYLRGLGFAHVVLVGNSGGGALAAFYQAQAERATVTAPPAGGSPDLTVADLPPADALVVLNAHRGRAQVLTAWLDPAVTDESDPTARAPDLDMFEPEWGPPYSGEFVRVYRAAQEARNRRITSWVAGRRSELDHAGVSDEAFVVHRTAADLRFLDLSLDPSDRAPGTYRGPDVRAANVAATGLGRQTTLSSWLSQWALDTTNAAAEPNLARCSIPALFLQGTADQGIFPSDAESLFAACGASDRELHWIVGGTHYFDRQPELQDQVFDRIIRWLRDRAMG